MLSDECSALDQENEELSTKLAATETELAEVKRRAAELVKVHEEGPFVTSINDHAKRHDDAFKSLKEVL
jgi:carbamate kinase